MSRQVKELKRSKKRIAVIGAGITGLTTAYRIKKKIEAENLPFELMILEAGLRAGGKIYTANIEGQFVDLGAESIDTRYPEGIALVKELGLENDLIYSEGDKQDIFFYNQLHQLPYPTYKGIPVNKSDIWKNKLLTFNGKLSSFKDSILPAEQIEEDLEMSQFLKRRLGEEMVEHIVEPFFSKVYASDLDDMGIKASREIIYFLEQEYGSISKGLAHHPELMDQSGNYVTFKQGLSKLTETLASILEPHIQYGKKVMEIRKGTQNTYILSINNKEEVRVGALCVAVPPTEYQNLLTEEDELNPLFSQIHTSSIGSVLFSFSKDDVPIEPKGFGVVTPRRNDSFVTSIVFLNKKWPSMQSSDDLLINVSFGRKGEDMLVSLSNREIEESILKDLETILGITRPPKYCVIKRWLNAIPQYTVKQEEEMKKITEKLHQYYQGVYIAGTGLEGFGISQCIRQGNRVGEEMVSYIKKQNCINNERKTD